MNNYSHDKYKYVRYDISMMIIKMIIKMMIGVNVLYPIKLLLPVYFFVILIGSQFNTLDKKFLNVVPSINDNNIYKY